MDGRFETELDRGELIALLREFRRELKAAHERIASLEDQVGTSRQVLCMEAISLRDRHTVTVLPGTKVRLCFCHCRAQPHL